ncbi:MAG: hypothetical protein R3Y56_10465 [Akkermansia sp.]
MLSLIAETTSSPSGALICGGVATALAVAVAFALLQNHKTKCLDRAIQAVEEKHFDEAQRLLKSVTSNQQFPESALCKAFVSAKMGDKAGCLELLKEFNETQDAAEYPYLLTLIAQLEGQSPIIPPVAELVALANKCYEEVAADFPYAEGTDEGLAEANRRLRLSVTGSFYECQLALLPWSPEMKQGSPSSTIAPFFDWYQAMLDSRID